MILDLSKPRDRYFERMSSTEILRRAFPQAEQRFTLAYLKRLLDSGALDVVVGTPEGDLDDLLGRDYGEFGSYPTDTEELVDLVIGLQPGQVILIPPEYQIDDTRQKLVYDTDALLDLFSAHNRGLLWGSDQPSQKLFEQLRFTPDEILRRVIDDIDDIEQPILGYTWFGKDRHRRIVPISECIAGAELRTFQNDVAFKLVTRRKEKELRERKHWRTGQPLTEEEITAYQRQLEVYANTVQRAGINKDIMSMDVTFDDLIEFEERAKTGRGHFKQRSGWHAKVPSRSQRDQYGRSIAYHIGVITGAYVHEETDVRGYGWVWRELRANFPTAFVQHNTSRRKLSHAQGNDEDLFDAHGIAALHSLMRIHKGEKFSLPFLPFVVPTVELMKFIHTLETQAILLTYNSETGRYGQSTLNDTEIGRLAFAYAVSKGYDAAFSADPETIHKQGLALHNALVRFER